MEQMLVTKALNELKLLDKRIMDTIGGAKFVTAAKESADKVDGRMTKDRFEKESKASYQSIAALIERRKAIKSAIVKSNASTTLTIGEKEMTVAEAIERKESIIYEQQLLNELILQNESAINKVDKENAKVNTKIEDMLVAAYGKDGKEKITEEMYDAIAKPYLKNNRYAIVEGFDAQNTIKVLKEIIDEFLSEVDTALQVSNSTTVISI